MESLNNLLKRTDEMLNTPHHYGCNFSESFKVEKAMRRIERDRQKEFIKMREEYFKCLKCDGKIKHKKYNFYECLECKSLFKIAKKSKVGVKK